MTASHDQAPANAESDTAVLRARVAELEAEAMGLRQALERGERAVARRDAWLRGVADAMPVLISFTDADQRFRFVNKAYEARFQRPRAEILGRTLREVMGPEVYEARRPYVERALRGERLRYAVDFPADGGLLHTTVEHIPAVSRAGEVLGFYSLVQDVTDETRAARALEESEARLRALTDNLPTAMIYQVSTSRDLRTRRYTYVSGNCERLTGVSVERALADPTALIGLIAPEQWDGVFRAELAAAESLTPLDVEVSGQTAEGRFIRSRIVSQPRPGPGDTLLWDGVVIDLTDRHVAEGALSESESRFRRIADSAPAPIWVTRLDRKREFANRAYVDFVGVDYEAALAFDWRTIIHPDDAPRIYAEQVQKEASLQPFTLEARYRRADGEWRWLRSESQPRWGADGAHQGFIGVAYDVTEARQAQADLQRLNELLETRVAERTAELEQLYRKAPVPLHSQDPSGVMISVSDRWLEFMGYESRDQVLGRRAVEFLTLESAARHLSEYWPRLLAQGFADDVEYQVVKRSGEVAEVLISSRLGRDADGKFARTMGAVVDVTARRRAEEQLRQAQKMEAIGQLTGGVAHDFNNLLTPVIGSLDLLRRRFGDDPRAARLVDAALQGADRAAALVQRLLAFARRQELRPEPVDVARLVEGLRELIQRSIGPQIQVEVTQAPDLPHALADSNQLELALLNLAVNARDAMPEGGELRVELDTAEAGAGGELPAGRYVRVSVVDTGVGMDAATLERAVEPFFSTKAVGKGTGLGLSMVHGLAAQSGGKLALFSQPGLGVRAELWLPVAEPPSAEATALPEPAAASARPVTVLLVDDEALVQGVTAAMLEQLGCRVVEADSGPEALALLAERPDIDALITDHLMPGMRGAELARTAVTRRPGLPVLLVTGYAEGLHDVEPSVQRLSKPYRQADLAAWLDGWR